MLQVTRYYCRRACNINKIMSPSSLLLLLSPTWLGTLLRVYHQVQGIQNLTEDGRKTREDLRLMSCSGPSGFSVTASPGSLFLWLLVMLGQWEAPAGDSRWTYLFPTPCHRPPLCFTALLAAVTYICGSGSCGEAPHPGLWLLRPPDATSPPLALQAWSKSRDA